MQHFSYLLLSCREADARFLISEQWSLLDFFQIVNELEEQGQHASMMWVWEGRDVRQMATTQITENWDPRSAVTDLLGYAVKLKSSFFGEVEKNQIMYFENVEIHRLDPGLRECEDLTRLRLILRDTLEISSSNGLLFICGRECSGLSRIPQEAQMRLSQKGLKYTDRFPENKTKDIENISHENEMEYLMKTIAAAILMYVSDNGNVFPVVEDWRQAATEYLPEQSARNIQGILEQVEFNSAVAQKHVADLNGAVPMISLKDITIDIDGELIYMDLNND